MRFTVAAAVLATSVLAHEAAISTDYATQLVTVIDCPPEVTNCPAHEKTTAIITSVVPLTTSTVLSTETIAVSTTVCPVTEATETPTHYANNTIVPSYTKPGPGGPPEQSNGPHTFTTKIPVGPVTTGPAPTGPAPTGPAACDLTSVTAITKSYTTVLATVEYSTIVGVCPTGEGSGSPKPSGSVVPPPCNGENCPKPTTAEGPKPTSPAGGNSTTPSNPPPVTAGAASFAGSALFAAAAGVAAYVFA